jgi:hypothetical protein
MYLHLSDKENKGVPGWSGLCTDEVKSWDHKGRQRLLHHIPPHSYEEYTLAEATFFSAGEFLHAVEENR